jgi:hypothetical protein
MPISARLRSSFFRTITIISTTTRRPTKLSLFRRRISWCSSARATQHLYYPEFLPDASRPLGLPWSSSGDRPQGVSECFGTIRYGRLAEILLYDIRRTATLAGPSAVYVDLEVEKWLRARSAATEVAHLIHVPSNPPGWTAGKWGEWYPDVLGPDKKLDHVRPEALLAARLAQAATTD